MLIVIGIFRGFKMKVAKKSIRLFYYPFSVSKVSQMVKMGFSAEVELGLGGDGLKKCFRS